jgi:hypothetical protein
MSLFAELKYGTNKTQVTRMMAIPIQRLLGAAVDR